MVPQVQSYRPETFGILTNPVGGNRLLGDSALRYITPLGFSFKKAGRWTGRTLASYCAHLSKNSIDCSEIYPKSVNRKSLYTRKDKNETSSSQPSISRYCRPWIIYLISDKKMLHWYLTDSGLMVFNQPLVDQELRGLLLSLYPSGAKVNCSHYSWTLH